jgi:transposase
MDETPVQVLKEPGKPAQSDSYMWLLSDVDARTVVFRYDAGRSGDVPLDMLGDYQGVLMVDGYRGYNAVCAKNSLTRLGCLAHVRRKFFDARESSKGRTGKADKALSWIQKLYAIERQIRTASPDERYAVRQRDAQPIVDDMGKWLDTSISQVPKGGKLGQAIAYAKNHWPNVQRYLTDGRYPIDNNQAENAIRPFAVGRKNWLFANSQSGARASANLYSLVQTASRHGLNPHEYLRRVFTELPTARTVEDIDALLPFNIEL